MAVAAELFEPLVAQAVGHGAGLGLGEELGGLAGIALFERGLGGLEDLVIGQHFIFGIAAAAAGQLDGGTAIGIDGLDRGFGLAGAGGEQAGSEEGETVLIYYFFHA